MPSQKHNFFFTLVVILSFIVDARAGFSDNDCLQSTSETKISYNMLPFGLGRSSLEIKKTGCKIGIHKEKFWILSDDWEVDVCRGPVHIKKGKDSPSVLKRESECLSSDTNTSLYCKEFKKILKMLQDDGLIFAEGEKENLASDHGQTFCSYLLITSYLENGIVFSRDQDYQNVLKADFRPVIEEVPAPKQEASSQDLEPAIEEQSQDPVLNQ